MADPRTPVWAAPPRGARWRRNFALAAPLGALGCVLMADKDDDTVPPGTTGPPTYSPDTDDTATDDTGTDDTGTDDTGTDDTGTADTGTDTGYSFTGTTGSATRAPGAPLGALPKPKTTTR